MPLPYRYQELDSGDLPFDIGDAKKYLKIEGSADNAVLQNLITTVVQWGERHTGRDFRIKNWRLILDCFDDRILIRKSPVASITTFKYTLLTVLTTIASTVYQFKQGHQFSEVLLRCDQEWPNDLDKIEAGIQIEFATAVPRQMVSYKQAALQHLAYLYENRGDCSVDKAAKKSGALNTYGTIIPRV